MSWSTTREGPSRPGTDLPELAAAWMESYRKNVVTAVLLTSALLPMVRRPGGRVIIVGSRVAITGGASPSYVAAKAALNGWVLSLARQLGPEGITANVVAPGYTAGTELLTGRMPAERHDRIVVGIAAGRPAQPCGDRGGDPLPGVEGSVIRQRAGARRGRRHPAGRLTPDRRRLTSAASPDTGLTGCGAHRSGRKNALRSVTNSSGSSSEGKWPPAGISCPVA